MGNVKTNGHSTHESDESHYVSLGASRIHYITAGHGTTTIVFVHCWAGNLSFWREQIPALADRARLIVIDLPGHGQSDKPQTTYTMDFFADAVLAVLRDAKVSKAIFVGHSMGAGVISRIYDREPERVSALICIDGLLKRPTGQDEQIAAMLVPFGTPQYLDHARQLIHTFFPTPGTEALRDKVMSEMLNTPQHVMVGGMHAMFGPRQFDWVLQNVGVPVAVINAPGFWWNQGYENYVRSITSQSEYMIMDDVGHFPMLEKPAEFNATLSAVLRKFGSLK
jgi:pimeloyl-ACP methyl ester carboxylesterase